MNIVFDLLELLDNTFIGTILAGTLLALFGLYLYKKQKKIDNEYEDQKKTREYTSLLFSYIELAIKEYKGQLNIYTGEYPILKSIITELNSKFKVAFQNDTEKRFNKYATEINKALNNLTAHRKFIEEKSHEEEMRVLAEKIPMLEMYLLSASVLHNIDIQEVKSGFEKIDSEISEAMQKLR